MLMKWFALGMLALTACSPTDILRQQGSTIRSTDYVQVALNEKQKKDAEKDAEARKQRDEKEAVQKHIDKAQAHLDLFEYEGAKAEYKEAYRMSNDPALLVKVAEAERRTGDCAEAAALYKQYLDKNRNAPDASSKVLAVQARIDEAKACETRSGSNFGQVRKLYKEGVTHYDLAEYDKAAKSFKEAYRLSNDPTYLFNVAQSYRMAKNCGEARRFYERVLQVQPDAPNRAKIEQRVAEMKSCKK